MENQSRRAYTAPAKPQELSAVGLSAAGGITNADGVGDYSS